MSGTDQRFSVIIPVYNVAPYLRQCLDSVLAQTVSDWEAICVDDGSTDESGLILAEYAAKDFRFKVFRTENSGLASARNFGLRQLNPGCSWVFFLDSDDYLATDFFQHLYDLVKNAEPRCMACVSAYWFHDGQLDFYKRYVSTKSGVYSPASAEFAFNCSSVWARIYPRKMFDEGVAFYEGMRLIEDMPFLCKASSWCKAVIVDREYAGVYYRLRASSLSHACGGAQLPIAYLRGGYLLLGDVPRMITLFDFKIFFVLGVVEHCVRAIFKLTDMIMYVNAADEFEKGQNGLWEVFLKEGPCPIAFVGARRYKIACCYARIFKSFKSVKVRALLLSLCNLRFFWFSQYSDAILRKLHLRR